jgi:hypothetical protein
MTTSFFAREVSTRNNMADPPHSLLSSVYLLKLKLKGRHFDTAEAIEAEMQAVLNSLTENDFQDPFMEGRSAGNGVHVWKGTTWVMVASRPKVSI